MLTNVQVVAGMTSVARFDDVVVWFETDPRGGGAVLPELLEAIRSVASGSVPPRQLGARLAAVLNAGDTTAVPALAAAAPEDGGLRVVVHGWGSVVADGIHFSNGWVDQIVNDRHTFFLGRNTVTPVAPVEGSVLDLEDGVVPGDGVSFALASSGAAPAEPALAPAPPGPSPPPPPAAAAPPGASSAAPVAAAPPAAASVPPPADPPAYEPPPSDPPPVVEPDESGGLAAPALASESPWSGPPPAPTPPSAGRIVLDDGRAAVLERTCVLGSAPQGSPAVQTGVALPLTLIGTGVAAIHVEIRVERGDVAVRDLGSAPTYVLHPGGTTWAPLAPGQISALAPGSRIAIGQRTLSYERL